MDGRFEGYEWHRPVQFSIQEQLLYINVHRFRGGLVSKAHGGWYHPTRDLRVEEVWVVPAFQVEAHNSRQIPLPHVVLPVLEIGVWCLVFGVWGLGSGIWCLGFEVWGLGFRVWGLEFGVWSLGFGV